MSPVIARIERIREEMNVNRRIFCERIGFSYPNYSHMEGKRKTKPNVDLLEALTRHTNVNSHWLLTGKGPLFFGEKLEFHEGGSPSGTPLFNDEYVLIPLYGVEGSAGEGHFVGAEDVEDLLAFKREWIVRQLRLNPDDLGLIHVRGESMVPTLNPGDVILLEHREQPATSDGIFVIRIGSALLVKRLQFMPNGQLLISSDNPAYQSFNVNPNLEAGEYRIIGKVVWAGHHF